MILGFKAARTISVPRAKWTTSAMGALLLIVLMANTAASAPGAGSAPVLAINQTNYVTAQGNFTVSMELASTANIQYVYFTFCQLSSPRCYLPVAMQSHGTSWFVGTTRPMTSYPGMTVGVKAGYNITIVYNDNTNVSEPAMPNAFGNLTIAQSVTGEFMFEMTVSNHVYGLSGVVYDASTHAGVSGASVTLTPGNGTAFQTTSTGAYSYTGLANGTYKLSVARAGYLPSNVTVVISGQTSVKDVAIANTTAPANHGGTPAGSGAGLFTPANARYLLLILSVVVVGVALVALAISRRRKGDLKPPTSPPSTSEPSDSST